MVELILTLSVWQQAIIGGLLLAVFLFGVVLGRSSKRQSPFPLYGDGTDLAPLQQDLERYRQQQEQLFGAMNHEIRSLNQMQNQLSHDASKLAQALKGSSNIQGQWGELQLRSVLELAGLLAYVNFVEQPTLDTVSGVLRPDAIIHLPGNRHLVVDSKAPLSAYLGVLSAENDTERVKQGVKLASAIKRHVLALSSKQYWQALHHSPDFVLMFIPNDSLLSIAGQAAPGLFDEAVRSKVLIVSPTTLIALAKTIAVGWRQHEMEGHAAKLTEQGETLYRRLAEITRSFTSMGKNLATTVESYNSLLTIMETQVVPAAKGLIPVSAREGTRERNGAQESMTAQTRHSTMPLGSVVNNQRSSTDSSSVH